MLFTYAIEKAEKDPNVEKLMRDGYFLGSVFATAQDSIEEWILHFYSSKKNKIVDCYVGEEVSIGEETKPMKKLTKLSLEDVKITAEAALAKAKKKFNGKTINILMTLHKKDEKEVVWTINMISPAMSATTYDIDAATGKILEEKETSLITSYSRAS